MRTLNCVLVVILATLVGLVCMPEQAWAAEVFTSYVTFFGFDDNDDGNPANTGTAAISDPIVHKQADEDLGTYDHPGTLAASKDFLSPGTIVYVPALKRYYVMEDICRECSDNWAQNKVHVDLYLNGTGEALSSCAYRLTMEKTEIIIDPPADLPVTSRSACEGGLNPPSATDQTLADNHSAFCSGEKGNQCSVNAALSDPLFLATQNLSAEERRNALDALSGEVHATVSSVLLDASRYVREAVLGRLKQAYYSRGQGDEVAPAGSAISHSDAWGLGPMPGGRSEPAPPDNSRLTFWTRAYRAWGKFDGDQDAASADSVLGGFLSGVDAPVSGSWRLGLATGFSQSDIDVDARHSTAAVDSTHLAAYTSGDVGAFALRAGAAWAWNDIETSRSVIFPGFFEREEAHYGADTGQVFGEVAYPVTMGEIALEPFAGLAFASVMSDGFKELGGIAALRSSGDDQDVSYSTLGLRAATTVNWNRVALTPHISAAWQHAFDEPAATTLAFASSGLGFDVTGVPLAENSLLVEAGLDLNVSPAITLGVSYSGQLASEVQDNAIKGRFSWRF